jgi:hypothetical protein
VPGRKYFIYGLDKPIRVDSNDGDSVVAFPDK